MLTKLTRHGQITLPKAVRERLHLMVMEGDYIDVEISEDDRGIVLRPRKMVAIDPDQEWFWTAEWQQAERAAEVLPRTTWPQGAWFVVGRVSGRLTRSGAPSKRTPMNDGRICPAFYSGL